MSEVQWIEGDTSEQVFTLQENGVAADLSGATVQLVLRPAPRMGGPLRVHPVDIVSASEGKVSFSPTGEELKVSESPYLARFRVTRNGVKSHFPNSTPDTWTVVE
jgi:hypothetical protein